MMLPQHSDHAKQLKDALFSMLPSESAAELIRMENISEAIERIERENDLVIANLKRRQQQLDLVQSPISHCECLIHATHSLRGQPTPAAL